MVLLGHGTQGLSRKSLLGRYLGLMGTTMTVALGARSASADQVTGVIEDKMGHRDRRCHLPTGIQLNLGPSLELRVHGFRLKG